MKKLFALIPLLAATQAAAGVMTFNLNDIGAFAGVKNTNTAATYAGTGYLGMYSNAWAHVLGVEKAATSRTIMQVDIGALAGKSIASAFLTFDLKDGDTGSQAGTLVGFDAGAGNLAYSWNAPTANYGSVAATLLGRGASSIDVTSLLAASLADHDTWFGMHLKGSTKYQWTSANSGSYAPNRANMLLTVNYADPVVSLPEPGSLLLLGAGLMGLAAFRRAWPLLDQR